MPLAAFSKPACVHYLVRFDDLCPTMNWEVWEAIEEILMQARLNPILAVVPDNRDPALEADEANPAFWERVRCWQQRGWTIGMHGYQHRYVSSSPGVLGLNARSEFAGLSEAIQMAKLTTAQEIFSREGVRADLWVAPAHSFDATTIRLLRGLDIGTISDGFALRPYRDLEMTWIPQQLWRFRALPAGVWTVCLHHNRWRKRDLELFRQGVERFQNRCTSVSDLLKEPVPSRRFSDKALGLCMRTALKAKRWAQEGER